MSVFAISTTMCIFDGFSIIYILSVDWVLSSIIYNYIETRRFSREQVKCMTKITHFVGNTTRQLLFLPSYWKPFTSPLPGETDEEYSYDNYHWITIFTGNGVISGFLIYNLINNYTSLSLSLFVISISSMSCFLINIISLYFVISWNRTNTFSAGIFSYCCKKGEKEYTHKFKSFTCFKNMLLFKCCCNKTIDRNNSGIDVTAIEQDITPQNDNNLEPENEIVIY